MSSFVGRRNGRTEVGEIDRRVVPGFVLGCLVEEWDRVAVVEVDASGSTLLGALRDGRMWIEPALIRELLVETEESAS